VVEVNLVLLPRDIRLTGCGIAIDTTRCPTISFRITASLDKKTGQGSSTRAHIDTPLQYKTWQILVIEGNISNFLTFHHLLPWAGLSVLLSTPGECDGTAHREDGDAPKGVDCTIEETKLKKKKKKVRG
jgi:hypothetical protein